jgi:cytoskeleton protein RodZ
MAPAPDVTSAVAAESEAGTTVPTQLASPENGPPPPLVAAVPDAETAGRVVLVARDNSWVQVRSPDRAFVRTRTLQPGERFVVPERDGLALWTGNAGGIELVVDGQSVGVVGAAGVVVRNLSLAPDALKARPVPAH